LIGKWRDIVAPATVGENVLLRDEAIGCAAREIGVKEPAGHLVTFAQMSAAPQK
jgi:hypothetical protein